MDKLLALILGIFALAPLPYSIAEDWDCKDRWTDVCTTAKALCSNKYVSEMCPLTCGLCSPSTAEPPIVGPTSNPFKGECGKPEVINTRVIGGTTARRGSWPWQILLMYRGTPMCGGSLIAPQWVITAAHCVYHREWSGGFSIRVGEQDWEINEGSEKEYSVHRVLRHSLYNPHNMNNDIALLKLRTPAILNKYVKPICLPKSDIPAGTECYITGWGKVRHPGQMYKKLQQAVLPVVTNDQCERKNRQLLQFPITDAMICGGDGGISTRSGCHGDSGGPFVCKVGGIWELHGAVSHGSPACKSTETYSVFARIFHFIEWIRHTVQRN